MESGQNFERLPELHALACGLKALVTQEVADAIDVLRKACGGQSWASPSSFQNRVWQKKSSKTFHIITQPI